MAFMKIFVGLSLVAICNAMLLFPDNGRFPFGQSNYRRYTGPRNPLFSNMADVLTFPSNFILQGFPNMGQNYPFPSVPIITPDDIRNTKSAPGQTYTGIYTHSGDGGTYMVANIDGHVLEYPGNTETSSVTMNMLPLKPPKFNMPPLQMFVPPIMNRDEMKNHVAGPNEHFSAVSTSSHSFSSDVNGVKKSGGSMSTLVNDGKNREETVTSW